MQQFVHYHTGKCQAIGVRPSRPSLKSSVETQTEKVELPSLQILPYRQMPNSTTTAVHPGALVVGVGAAYTTNGTRHASDEGEEEHRRTEGDGRRKCDADKLPLFYVERWRSDC